MDLRERGKETIRKLAKIKGVSFREAEKLIAATEKLKREVRRNMVTAITAAFGFMIAFVWRDAIQESVDKIVAAIGLAGETYFFRIVSALIITVIAVVGLMFVSRWAEKKE